MKEDKKNTASSVRPAPGLVSIVVPMHNELENIDVLVNSIRENFSKMNAEMEADMDFEIICVDDGSTDGTFHRVEELSHESRDGGSIRGVSLSRNFGHQYALLAGLQYARGDVTVMMDADMQHPPEIISQLIAKWREHYNIVQAVRSYTHDGGVKRTLASVFYRMFSFLCGIRLRAGSSDFRLVDKMVLNEIKRLREGQLFLRGLVSWMGYRRVEVPYEVGLRYGGKRKYTYGMLYRLAKSGIFSFSTVPLRIGTSIGIVMSILSFAELIFVLVAKVGGWVDVPGWASLAGIISLLFGVLFLLVGIQGEYIIRIYERVQNRPGFLVERTAGMEKE